MHFFLTVELAGGIFVASAYLCWPCFLLVLFSFDFVSSPFSSASFYEVSGSVCGLLPLNLWL